MGLLNNNSVYTCTCMYVCFCYPVHVLVLQVLSCYYFIAACRAHLEMVSIFNSILLDGVKWIFMMSTCTCTPEFLAGR